MIRRTISEIAALCGGTIHHNNAGDPAASGVTINSRKVTPGQLFVPIKGENFDGHDFAVSGIENGAVGTLWQRDKELPDALANVPVILVDDTTEALQQLAASYRDALDLHVIGVTGSNGKTSTKDMVAAVLSGAMRVHKTDGNYNNHIGLPLTLLDLSEDDDAVVLEMGMSEFGEIDLLTRLAKPDVAIITNIGDAHMQQLGSRAGIAKAKLEIVAGLRAGGLLLVNGDEPLLHEGLAQTVLPEGVEVQTFGLGCGNQWTAEAVTGDAISSTFDVSGQNGLQRIALPVAGAHNVSNVLAAIAAAKKLGVQDDVIRAGIHGLKLTGMRIEPIRAYNGAMMLNDAYNSNPTAVRAAIDLLAGLSGYRRKWLVLGDMLELGPDEAAMHGDIGAYVTPDKVDAVLTYGPLSQHTASEAAKHFEGKIAVQGEKQVCAFEDKNELAQWLRERIAPEDLVLVKGSRGMRMEEIVHSLQSV